MKYCKVLMIAALTVAGSVAPARAEDPVGRYQMVPLANHPGSFDNRVMILDTRDGHLWQWWESTPVGGSLGGGGSGITYLGKVTPGEGSRRPSLPEPIVPKR